MLCNVCSKYPGLKVLVDFSLSNTFLSTVVTTIKHTIEI